MISAWKRLAADESGSVIIAAVMILVVLTIVGIWAINTTIVEYQVATNDQVQKIAFQNADSGLNAVPKLISKSINESSPQDPADFNFAILACGTCAGSYGDDIERIYNQIMLYDTYNSERDIALLQAEVDIRRAGQRNAPGSGVEFGTGAEGLGVGSAGGVHVLYSLDSTGSGPRSSSFCVNCIYRKVVGMPGGL
jgi:Tfp pilus assembly protein PilX